MLPKASGLAATSEISGLSPKVWSTAAAAAVSGVSTAIILGRARGGSMKAMMIWMVHPVRVCSAPGMGSNYRSRGARVAGKCANGREVRGRD